jgi:porphobilinogen synthase
MESQQPQYYNQRRLRTNSHIRELVATVQLHHNEFIQPIFVDESISKRTPITSLNQINSDTIATAIKQIEQDVKNGITKFLLFPVPKHKVENNFDYSFAIKAVSKIKAAFGTTIWLAADVCLCAYTTHGHCGILNNDGNKVINTKSVETLASYALQLAQAGANCIAPSDMMDGRVAAIRTILNNNNLDDVAIMSYSAKFSSQFYGPFRDACKSAPGVGTSLQNRKTYQISPFNANDAIASTLRDISESADIIMVKPALPYIDIIYKLSQTTNMPIAAYHVSGEYQGIELLAQHNLVDRHAAHIEVWAAIKRSGANIIISYAARQAKNWIENINY